MRQLLLLAFLSSTLTACVSTPGYLAQPADPSLRVPRSAYRPVADDVRTYRPAEPKGWEDVNRRVAPRS